MSVQVQSLLPAPLDRFLRQPEELEKLEVMPQTSSARIQPSIDEQLVTQLGRLASQHHVSAYNCIKFGPKGAPSPYIPLTIQLPEQAKETRENQMRRAAERAWWPCRKDSAHPTASGKNDVRLLPAESKGPHIFRPSSSADLQKELSIAMSSSLTINLPAPVASAPINGHALLRTSETHPINLSLVIPFELLPVISSYLDPKAQPSSVMFDLQPCFQLQYMLSHPSRLSWGPAPPIPDVPPSDAFSTNDTSRHTSRPSNLVHLLWGHRIVRKAVACAPFHGTKGSSSKHPANQRSPDRFPSPSDIPSWEEHTAESNSRGNASEPKYLKATGLSVPCHSLLNADRPSLISVPSLHSASSMDTSSSLGSCSAATSVSSIASASSEKSKKAVTLGNLFLSSCPGKKVRVSGPVKGRCGVCRDLGQDFRRIKALGVDCIVCCLDDDELNFLGVPWPEYSRTADETGLDILRIPIPEGFAPLDAETLDAHLIQLIDMYSLKGIPILVHCRGGVGRAGLVACCWMLKLGLCGWVEQESQASHADAPGAVKKDTLEIVERAIGVVRRRRSPKAIETYEQVRFLADYVEYLRGRALGSTVSAPGDVVQGWDFHG